LFFITAISNLFALFSKKKNFSFFRVPNNERHYSYKGYCIYNPSGKFTTYLNFRNVIFLFIFKHKLLINYVFVNKNKFILQIF